MRLTDPRALRAMAHPLRLDLLELLGIEGPLTAADCARRLGASQASCSYHLRELGRYGMVADAPGGADHRERPWQLTDVEQRWSSADAPVAAAQLDRVMVQREADRRLAWIASAAAEPAEWQEASFFGGATLPLTVDELEALGGALRVAIEPYVARVTDRSLRPPGARPVRILLGSTPLPPGQSS